MIKTSTCFHFFSRVNKIYNIYYIHKGNFRSTEQGENFKSSETWLYLFKIMKKKNRNQFLVRYMQMFKSYSNLKISKF